MSEEKPGEKRVVSNYSGRRLALDAINRVTMGGGFANVLLRNMPDNPGITADDRGAASNLVYGTLRNITLLDEILRSKSKRGKLTLQPKLLNIARMAAFEIIFMQDIPSYASVSEYMKMARANGGGKQECGFLNACLRNMDRTDLEKISRRWKDPVKSMALRYSHPEWLARAITDQYGLEAARLILKSANNPQPTYFRVNTLKINMEELISKFEYSRINTEVMDAPPNCLAMQHGEGPFPVAEYNAGWITAQDRSTQFIPYILSPQPGDRVLDLCCGSGIKTAQIAEISGGCEITAVDNLRHKLDSLEKECARLGIEGIKTVCADITAGPGLGEFDKVLLDAPCSGSGTFRRRPEIKMRLSRESVLKLTKIQDSLLDAAAGNVGPGGTLVYSTCSILKIENENRVEGFLDRNPGFSSVPPETIALPFPVESYHLDRNGITFTPSRLNAGGAFAAVLKKNG